MVESQKYERILWLFHIAKDFLFVSTVILSKIEHGDSSRMLCRRKLMKVIQKIWVKPQTQWVWKTLYYLFILLALLGIYGFKDTTSSTFIYNEF